MTIKKFPLCTGLAVFLLSIVYGYSGVRADDSGLVAIYPYATGFPPIPASQMKPIILQIPEAFRYGSSEGATRAYGINIMTFYPSFTSPRDPRNAPFIGECTGDCNGRVLIYIENSPSTIHHPGDTHGEDFPNMGDAMAHAFLEHPLVPNGAVVTRLGPQHGFDSGLQIDASKPSLGGRIERYFFHLGKDGMHYDLAVGCTIYPFRKTCSLHFSLKCDPAVYIQVGRFDMSQINQFLDFRDRVNRFVSSMVRKPACV